MTMSTTVSRRHVLASAAGMTPALALAASSSPATNSTNADPVFAAIERHRTAMQAWLTLLDAGADLPSSEQCSLAHEANACGVRERNALLNWLTTQPTTMQGVIATLEYASRPDEESNGDHVHTNLAESAQYDDPSDILAAGERFPQMIAEALHKITGS